MNNLPAVPASTNPRTYHPAVGVAEATPTPSVPPPGAGLWAVPVRRWPVTLALLAAAVAVGVAAAQRYGQHLWQIEGTLVYTPLPVSDHLHGEYTPPNPQTLLSLIKSPQGLERVVREFDLPVSAKTLDRCLRVNKPSNADAVSLVLDWPDPDTGRAVVDRLMQMHSDEVIALRQEKIREGLDMLKVEKAVCERRLDEVRAAYAALPAGTNPERLKTEWGYATKEVSSLGTDLSQARDEIARCREKINRCIAREKSLTSAQATAEGEFDLDEVSAPYRKRKEELVDAIRTEEHRIAECDVQIAAKQKEVVRLRSLLASRAVGPLEFEKATTELDVFTTKRKNAEAAAEHRRRELAELPLNQVRADRADLERQKAQLESRAAALQREMELKRKEAARAGDLIAAEAGLSKQLERAEAEHRGVEARMAALERLGGAGVREFTAAHPAAASAQPTSSNKKSIAAVTFAGLFGMGMLGLVGHAKLTNARCAKPATTYGLPVLAASDREATGTEGTDRALEARQLALRLRGPAQQSGGMILFSGADEATGTEDVVGQLARYLALWGESVLVLDARIDRRDGDDLSRLFPSEAPALPAHPVTDDSIDFTSSPRPGDSEVTVRVPRSGLFHVLQSPAGIDETAFIQETPLTGVNYLPVGAVFPNPDLLASVAMHRLLVKLSGQYNKILVIGPGLNQPVASEILAGYADGAVVAFRRCADECPKVAQAVEAVRNAGVPWVGSIVRA